MSGNIIKELRDCCSCVFGDFGLLGTDGAESSKEFMVNGPCIVQEGTNNTLNLLDAGGIEGWTCVNIEE